MRTITNALALAALLTLTACAAALPFIAASVEAAAEALKWIDRIDAHLPTVEAINHDAAQRARDASAKARAVAECVQSRGTDCGDLEHELRDLLTAAAPLKVRELPPGMPADLLGSSPDGSLNVPSACEIVRGAEACSGGGA